MLDMLGSAHDQILSPLEKRMKCGLAVLCRKSSWGHDLMFF
ncbi:MAG: hypothetical protein ACNI3A_07430 [Desulfovibrio sp.]